MMAFPRGLESLVSGLWGILSMPTMIRLTCTSCRRGFDRSLSHARTRSSPTYTNTLKFCSNRCGHDFRVLTLNTTLPCGQCGLPVTRLKVIAQKSKSGHLFCNHHCAATYANTHKTKGTRRSKLEVWLETQLLDLYPHLTLLPNDKTTINSELDLYFPDLNLAFELNGPLHYEPIYGPEKLASIQNNDTRKFQACLEKGISLAVIDTSKMVYFKPKAAHVVLDLIVQVIGARTRI